MNNLRITYDFLLNFGSKGNTLSSYFQILEKENTYKYHILLYISNLFCTFALVIGVNKIINHIKQPNYERFF